MTEETDAFSQAYNQALKYLGARAHTVFEIEAKLKRKKIGKEAVQAAIKELLAQNYLNDREFAQTFVQNLAKYKTFGYYGIKLKLRQRGIDQRLAEEILSQELDLETEEKIARRAMAKSGKKDPIKTARMLSRKGFRSEIISRLAGDFSLG